MNFFDQEAEWRGMIDDCDDLSLLSQCSQHSLVSFIRVKTASFNHQYLQHQHLRNQHPHPSSTSTFSFSSPSSSFIFFIHFLHLHPFSFSSPSPTPSSFSSTPTFISINTTNLCSLQPLQPPTSAASNLCSLQPLQLLLVRSPLSSYPSQQGHDTKRTTAKHPPILRCVHDI